MATIGCSYYHNKNNNNKNWLIVIFTCAIWTFLTLTNGTAVQAAAVYSNIDFLSNPSFEPICAEQQERFIESEGKESSLILEFNAPETGDKTTKSCKRILSAPPGYGFIVRLILPKIRKSHQHHHSSKVGADAELGKASGKSKKAAVSALNEMTSLIEKLNSTALKTALGRSCPLSIFSSLDPHTPQYRVDPCQLEDTAPEMEDPVRLFHGRVRIVWEHAHQALDSKLMVTVLGKGEQCRSEEKHQCLKIGDEPILCIAKDLICDGIRHCPNSNEYDSDEDYEMCWRRLHFGKPLPSMESDIFEHFALEVFRNLFAFDVPSITGATTATTLDSNAAGASANNSSTTLRKVHTKEMSPPADGEQQASEAELDNANAVNATVTNGTESTTGGGSNRRNSTRLGLNSDLSKYGPWGYLMLGMLLCGGALLICGLWASASQHAANNERESNLQYAGNAANSSSNENPSNGAPPNYEELDPPPPYSVLFPNQKAASSTTLNSLSTAAVTALAPALPPALAESISAAASETPGASSATTITRVQLETQASGSASGSGSSSSVPPV